MGLISWIKNTHYDHRLQKADELADNKQYKEASAIYQSLLGKQQMAVVHLSRMLVETSDSCSTMLQNLKLIEGFREYLNEVNSSDYKDILLEFVKQIEKKAQSCFANKSYDDAVALSDAVIPFYKQSAEFTVRSSRYHAHLIFYKSQSKNIYSPEYKQLLQFLSWYPSGDDIETFVEELYSQRRYSRIISLLTPIVKQEKAYESKIIECSILVVEGKDCEVLSIKSLLAICDNKSINKKSSKKIWELSERAGKQSLFAKCIEYDTIAGEYLGDDEDFNLDRCMHILEELAPRCDANEVEQLQKLATTLKLQDVSMQKLNNRVYEIATAAAPEKSMGVCYLFKEEERYRSLYIQKALAIAQTKHSSVKKNELKSIIIANTDADSIVDVIAQFLPYFKDYSEWFVELAAAKIKTHSDVTMLDKYWDVYQSGQYFFALIEPSYDSAELFAKHIAGNTEKYLYCKDFVSCYGEDLVKLNQQDTVLSLLEELIRKDIELHSYYKEKILSIVEPLIVSSPKQGLETVNHALEVLPAQQDLLIVKKRIIRELITGKEFDIALSEAKSIETIDDEAFTILAETHLAKALSSKGNKAKKKELFEVLSINEQHRLYDSFASDLEKTLSELSASAEKLYEVDETEAYDICNRIEAYQTAWLHLYLILRSKGVNAEATLAQRIKYHRETLDTVISKIDNSTQITEQSYWDLWKEYVDLLLDKSKAQPHEKAVSSLNSLKEEILKFFAQEEAAQAYVNVTYHVLKHLWALAIESESNGDYKKAIEHYESVQREVHTCDSLSVSEKLRQSAVFIIPAGRVVSFINKAALRELICLLKSNGVNLSVETIIKDKLETVRAHEDIKEDLAYRYAYYLLSQTRPEEAECIIKTYLPNEKELLDFCQSIFVKRAELDLKEFNEKVGLLRERKMSSVEAETFLSEIDTYKAKISSRLPDTSNKFDGYKEKVRAYILGALFDEEKYREVYDWLRKTSPKYITDDDNAFRNIAIAALRMIESGTVQGAELKRAISIFVTAVYTDRLFVKSLDYTEWDDEYSFTLKDSLGDADFDYLPDNVSYEDPVENQVVSIKDVQNSLLNRLEVALREHYPSLESFFQEEKSALESLVDLQLDQKCGLVAPYLSKDFKQSRDEIEDSFAVDLSKDYGNHEQIYELGVKYGFTGGDYTKYAIAMNNLDACVKALDLLEANPLITAFAYVESIREFDKLFSELKSKVTNTISKAVKDEMEYRKFLDVFYSICQRMKDSNISFACTQYVNGQVVKRLNAKTMELRVGADYLYKLYQLTPSNVQVKENLEGVLQQLAEKSESNGTSADREVLNRILSGTGNTFASAIVTAKIAAIAAKLKDDKISSKQALEQVYDLYCNDKSNDIVCGILAALCVRCIHEYIIGDKYGRSSVETLLDKLAVNRSQKFLIHAKEIAKAHNQIWNKLDIENKFLLSGNSLPNKSLNSNGYALKSGLEYMRKLAPSGSTSTGLGLDGLGGFGGLFG